MFAAAIDQLNALDIKRSKRLVELQKEEERAEAAAREDEAQVRAMEASFEEHIANSIYSPPPKLTFMSNETSPTSTENVATTSMPADIQLPDGEASSPMDMASEVGSALGGEAGDSRPASAMSHMGDGEGGSDKKRKKRLTAGDIALNVLSVASDVREGLQFVGLVDDTDYVDIEDHILERMCPDPDYDEDTDLMDIAEG